MSHYPNVRFIASGDWDSDSNVDICVTIQQMIDTLSGHAGWDVSRLVIFWGNAEGNYSLADTTHLENGLPIWLGPSRGRGEDRDGDHIDDLLIVENSGLKDGQPVKGPSISIFRGQRGMRWGRGGTSNTPGWNWWNPPGFYRIDSRDLDCDQATDLILSYDEVNTIITGSVSVLYGKPGGGLPDTSSLQTLDLSPVQGHDAMFIDITGDGMPELLVNSLDEVMRVYAGEPGIRLLEQFGSGNDGPDLAHGRAYRRPWAAFPLPNKLDNAYPYGGVQAPYDLGDAGLDGFNDIWVQLYPEIICYNAGEMLDSLFDSYILPRGEVTDVVKLGDIDGSGIPTIAIGYGAGSNRFGGGVQLVKPSKDVSQAAEFRDLPHKPGIRCQSTAAMEEVDHHIPDEAGRLQLLATPNPGAGEIRISWKPGIPSGEATMRVYDLLGRVVATRHLPASTGVTGWDCSGMASGVYVVTLAVGDVTESVRVVLR